MTTPAEDPVGTVRRAPAPSFAHGVKLDQGGNHPEWMIIDAYGPLWGGSMETHEYVKDWPVVYTPVPDEQWKLLHDLGAWS